MNNLEVAYFPESTSLCMHIFVQMKRCFSVHFDFFDFFYENRSCNGRAVQQPIGIYVHSGVNGLVEEAIVSTESCIKTNANPCAKLRPRLLFENQAPKHLVGLRLMDCFDNFLEQQ